MGGKRQVEWAKERRVQVWGRGVEKYVVCGQEEKGDRGWKGVG